MFDRDLDTGLLELRGVVRNGSGVSGLLGASGLFLSADGTRLYVSSTTDNAVLTFSRDSAGDLAYMGRIDGQGFPSGVAGAPGGSRLFFQQAGAPRLSHASINPMTGVPAEPGSAIELGPGSGFTGWFGARSFVVSPDDRFVYSLQSGRHEMRAVDVSESGFGSVSSYENLQDGITGLANPVEVALSPEPGAPNLYVVGGEGISGVRIGTIAVFTRDPNTGALAFVQSLIGPEVPTGGGISGPPPPPGPPPPAPTPPGCPNATETSPPPPGPIGISINEGARFTNTPRVTLEVVWPGCTSALLISNDGGFRKAQSRPVSARTPWVLDSSGPERLPKTVYLRFDGAPVNFTDDIILDQTPPLVIAATASIARRMATSNGRAERRPAETVRVRIRARDRVSGIRAMKVTDDRRRPVRARPFRGITTFDTGKNSIFVRVRDGAGNWSAWTKVGCFRMTRDRDRCLARARAATRLSVARANARERLRDSLARCRSARNRAACERRARNTYRAAASRAVNSHRRALARIR